MSLAFHLSALAVGTVFGIAKSRLAPVDVEVDFSTPAAGARGALAITLGVAEWYLVGLGALTLLGGGF